MGWRHHFAGFDLIAPGANKDVQEFMEKAFPGSRAVSVYFLAKEDGPMVSVADSMTVHIEASPLFGEPVKTVTWQSADENERKAMRGLASMMWQKRLAGRGDPSPSDDRTDALAEAGRNSPVNTIFKFDAVTTVPKKRPPRRRRREEKEEK